MITIDVGTICELNLWEQACDTLGINPWARNEGLLTNKDELTFTLDQAQDIGLIAKRRSGW